MFRRSVILALVLSVAGLGIAPDVLCAVVCARSNQMPCCQSLGFLVGLQNRVGQSSSDTTADCQMACTFLKVRLQSSQRADSAPVFQQGVRATIERDIALPNRAPVQPVQSLDTSPPPVLALLCSFLI
jgi:hypothetical protein